MWLTLPTSARYVIITGIRSSAKSNVFLAVPQAGLAKLRSTDNEATNDTYQTELKASKFYRLTSPSYRIRVRYKFLNDLRMNSSSW